ncbi:MAG TPA: aminopeptidase [Solirubrobacteraceae bacterium]|nr:aminopeptidase [Solirubrobacteraceae bacterium]
MRVLHDEGAGSPPSPPLERFADLVVGFAANVQPGQVVAVGSEPGKEPLTRAVADAAYHAGAKFVDVQYFDLHVKRSRILHAAEDTLDYVPSWYGERILALGDQRCARIGLSGSVAPGLLDGLDPARAGHDQLPFVRETGIVVNAATTNWTIVPCPTVGWAQQVYPDLDPDAALARLWEQVVHVCRLDEDDPVAAWTARLDDLITAANRLTARRFSELHLEGPGTDLHVGLLPTSTWICASFDTVDGIRHMPNLPSEEVFSAPDPQRVDGVVAATKPLDLGGTIVEGLRVRFEGGRAVQVDAEANADALRARVALDEGAARLGEIALVDREGRIGPLDTVFYDTLLDENAATHVALGNAYAFCAEDEDKPRLNTSAIHIDFMIGSSEVAVTGVTDAGERVPVLRDGSWQLG